jgi:hypothetical protein
MEPNGTYQLEVYADGRKHKNHKENNEDLLRGRLD